MTFKKGQVTNPAGRPKGSENKVVTQARAAIALFVDSNAHRLQEWLDMIAHGYKVTDEKGNEKLIAPNPQRAFELFQAVIEYHVPKLQRTEISSEIEAPLIPPTDDDKAILERFISEQIKKREKING